MKSLTVEPSSKTKEIALPDKHKVSLYYSIYELPIGVYTEFQKYAIQTAMGTTIDEINLSFSNLDNQLAAGKLQEAIQERTNMHYGLFYGLNKITISHYSFACLVHSIDGDPRTDKSEQGLRETIDILARIGLTQKMVREYLSEVKKNLLLS